LIMATKFKFICSVCSTSTKSGKMITALRQLAEQKMPTCCSQPQNLSMQFDFAFGVNRDPFHAVAAYLPNPIPQWHDGNSVVDFSSFLVVLQREDGSNQSIWLPYWHIVTANGKTKHKYGQWAPFMRIDLFSQLVGKAVDAGYSVG